MKRFLLSAFVFLRIVFVHEGTVYSVCTVSLKPLYCQFTPFKLSV